MTHDRARREGFALPVALMAMMVIGAIVTGGFYAASQENQVSSSVDLGSEAFYIAEYGLNESLGTWRSEVLTDVQDSLVMDTVAVVQGGQEIGRYVMKIRPLGHRMYLVESTGIVEGGRLSATRRVGAAVRTAGAQMPAPTALAIYGGLTVGGNSNIHGNDAGGAGCEQGDTVAGVTAYDTTLVSDGNRDRITGDPPVTEDATLDTSALSTFGSAELDELRAMATHVYEDDEDESGMSPDSVLLPDGSYECDMSVKSNWGEPNDTLSACGDAYPIIHVKGDMDLQTGRGQGILIVDGNLHATGNFDFYGIVVVLGELTTGGTGNHFEGSVVVQGNGNLESESSTLGNSLVQYSECAVQKAFDGNLRPELLVARSWFDFTAAVRGDMTFVEPST